LRERGAYGFEEAPDFRNSELLSEGKRGESRFEQNLIGVGVANPTEQTRISEGALKRVVRRKKN
jgi:hypothetical protein